MEIVQPIASPSTPSVRLIALLEPDSTKNINTSINQIGICEITGYFTKGTQSSRIMSE